MSRKHKFHDNDKRYFISFATVYWIDVFIREEYLRVIIESRKHCHQKKGLEIYGWCIIPGHIHMIMGSKNNKLQDIVRDMKKHTSATLKTLIKENPQERRKEWMVWMMERAGKKNGNNIDWQFWQQHNKPIEMKDQQIFDKILEYIHQNPVIGVFVNKPEDWRYSSAGDFYEMKGLIELSYN